MLLYQSSNWRSCRFCHPAHLQDSSSRQGGRCYPQREASTHGLLRDSVCHGCIPHLAFGSSVCWCYSCVEFQCCHRFTRRLRCHDDHTHHDRNMARRTRYADSTPYQQKDRLGQRRMGLLLCRRVIRHALLSAYLFPEYRQRQSNRLGCAQHSSYYPVQHCHIWLRQSHYEDRYCSTLSPSWVCDHNYRRWSTAYS